MARRPKPVEQHKRDGTYRPARHDGKTLLIAGRVKKPVPSRRLSARGRECFEELAAMLEGILDGADIPLLEIAAETWAEFNAATADIEERGHYIEVVRGSGIKERTDRILNPSLAIRDKAVTHLRQLFNQLGIALPRALVSRTWGRRGEGIGEETATAAVRRVEVDIDSYGPSSA